MPGGGRLDYRLGVSAGGVVSYTDGRWVVVPVGVAFGITKLSPNPARGALSLIFALAIHGTVSTDLFSITGRRVVHRVFTGLEPGEHSAALGQDRQLAPGAYVLRLSQSDLVVRRKITMLP